MANLKSAMQDPPLAGRISVVRDQRLVPLLASTQTRIPLEQPWEGVLLEQHLVRSSEIPEHEHPDLCLHLQLSGADDLEWWSAGRNALEHTAPGSLILIPPGTTDRLRWTGPSERLILSIRPRSIDHLARELGATRSAEFRTQWSFRSPALQHLIVEMGREARAGWPLGSLYAGLLSMSLETQLLKTHAVDPLKIPPLKGLSLPKLKRALEYINANLAEDLRLDAIAKELDLSPSHFAHEFRNKTGQTPYQYLIDQRIAKAMDLLRRTSWSVQYISGLAGFGSTVNFVRTFRQRVGAPPETWRRSL